MWIADEWKDYELLDCGGGEKLERWDKQYPGASGPPGHLGNGPAVIPAGGNGPTPGISRSPDRRRTLGQEKLCRKAGRSIIRS